MLLRFYLVDPDVSWDGRKYTGYPERYMTGMEVRARHTISMDNEILSMSFFSMLWFKRIWLFCLTLTFRMLHASHAFCKRVLPSIVG